MPAGSGPRLSLEQFFRLESPLCRHFLALATAGDAGLDAAVTLFPFIREAVRLEIPRTRALLPDWLYCAFIAGHDLGEHHPELLEVVLPEAERFASQSRLEVLQSLSGTPQSCHEGLIRAARSISAALWEEVPEAQLDAIYAEAALKQLRTGFAAATLGRHDPHCCEFWNGWPDAIRHRQERPLFLHWWATCSDTIDCGGIFPGEHLVLSLARTLYRGYPEEGQVVLGFLDAHLQAAGIHGDAPLAITPRLLIDWIADAVAAGEELQKRDPDRVKQIFARRGEVSTGISRRVVRRVVAAAGGTDPVRLLRQFHRWERLVYGPLNSIFPGRRLSSLALYIDFALWIPWVLPSGRGPENEAVQAEGWAE